MKTIQNIEILFQDDDFIFVNKPPNILTIPDRFTKDSNDLFKILRSVIKNIYVVHRLDKETSGAICFAKNKEAHREMNIQFEERLVKKTYLALIAGCPAQNEGIIDLPICEDSLKKGIMKIDDIYGKNSITEYKVIERFKFFSLVEAYPLTGRMHQIRVHFQALGFPLAVDSVYGRTDKIFLSNIKPFYKHKKDIPEKPIMDRLTLHSLKITFTHFRTKQNITVEAPLPKDLAIFIKQLRRFG